jgi:hypothetical protein
VSRVVTQRFHAAGICDCCDAPLDEVGDSTEKGEELIEELLVTLGHFDTRFLRHARNQAELVNADGWLYKMLAEYLQVWR